MSPSQIFSVTASGDDDFTQQDGSVYPPTSAIGRNVTQTYSQAQRAFFAGPVYAVNCALIRFDTSNLPDNAIVNSATLRLYMVAASTPDSLSVVGEWYTWNSTDPDHSHTPPGSPNAFVATGIGAFTASVDNDLTLINPTNVSTTGNTSLRFHVTQRASDAAPTGQSQWAFASYDGAGGTYPAGKQARLIVDYTVPNQETLRPTSVQLTSLSGAATDIDDDPENPDSLWLTGTDPSATAGNTNGPEYPNARTGATGQTAFVWDANIANVTDTSDSTLSIEPSASTTKGDYFTIPAAAFTDLPSDASITGFSVAFKHRAGTANRVTVLAQLGTANGTLIGAEQTVISTLAATAGGVTHTVSSWGATPSRADLVSGTFGIRLRITRSNTSTYELYSMKATATYTGGAATTNTEARVAMGDPTGTLATGAATGEVRLQARKLGSGTSPQARVEVYETTDLNTLGTLKATPIADTTVSAANPGAVLSGTFDQSVIGNKNNVVLRVLGTGALGGLVEPGALEWNANTQAVAATSLLVPTDTVQRMLRRR